MKITLIQKRPWKNSGYTGIGYAGFSENGEVVKFNSINPGAIDHEIFEDAQGFDKNRCEEIKLGVKIWQGKVSRRELTPEQVERMIEADGRRDLE